MESVRYNWLVECLCRSRAYVGKPIQVENMGGQQHLYKDPSIIIRCAIYPGHKSSSTYFLPSLMWSRISVGIWSVSDSARSHGPIAHCLISSSSMLILSYQVIYSTKALYISYPHRVWIDYFHTRFHIFYPGDLPPDWLGDHHVITWSPGARKDPCIYSIKSN